MISRFNLDQKRLTFYENPELFHNEFTELISSNNDNEFFFPRSSIKIFQAIPFAMSNAIKNYKYQ